MELKEDPRMNRMQPDFGELALPSAADAGRYVATETIQFFSAMRSKLHAISFGVISLLIATNCLALKLNPETDEVNSFECFGTITRSDGAEYKGDIKNGNMDGRGILKFPEGHIYEGEFKYNKFSGQGVITAPNGDKYVGGFNLGKLSGIGVLTLSNGAKIMGEFRNGNPDGNASSILPGGDIYIGEFKSGRFHGNGVYIWSNGDRYEGDFIYLNFVGDGTFTTRDGEAYTGKFKRSKAIEENAPSYLRNGITPNRKEFGYIRKRISLFEKLGRWENSKPHEFLNCSTT